MNEKEQRQHEQIVELLKWWLSQNTEFQMALEAQYQTLRSKALYGAPQQSPNGEGPLGSLPGWIEDEP